MFSLDDRAGNVTTTVALFVAVAAVLYAARAAVLVFVLSLLFAYLVEPAVEFVQNHSPLGRGRRNWAIAQIYLTAVLVAGILVYEVGPQIVAQTKRLNSTVVELCERLSAENATLPQNSNTSQEARLQSFLLRHRGPMTHAFGRAAASAAYVAEKAVWILAVPILAIFFLKEGRQMASAFLNTMARPKEKTFVAGVFRDIDTTLARYVRAQLALAGLSCLFYSLSMSILRFPYAIALGVLGGVLEFLPVAGWLISATMILAVGILTHSHWIAMAALLGLWRLLQAYVNSPRIMGGTLQLPPLMVLFALMIGGQLAGVAGVFLAVPAVAVLRIVRLQRSAAQMNPCPGAEVPGIEIGGAETNSG